MLSDVEKGSNLMLTRMTPVATLVAVLTYEYVVSMPAVRLFVGSGLTISFGLACTGDTYDRNAFKVLFQKVQCLGSGFSFSANVSVSVQSLPLGFRCTD